MADYWLSEAGQTLFSQINRRWPKRSKASDGWVGDASHAAGPSDHNPCWTCTGDRYGVVRAVDIDGSLGGKAGYNTTREAWTLANQLRKAMVDGDGRISYIIAWDPDRGKDYISSMNTSYHPLGVWRDYNGDSHVNHVHVSFTPQGDHHSRLFKVAILESPRLRKAKAAAAAARIAVRKAKNLLSRALRRLRRLRRS
jgi:hypothetical protein